MKAEGRKLVGAHVYVVLEGLGGTFEAVETIVVQYVAWYDCSVGRVLEVYSVLIDALQIGNTLEFVPSKVETDFFQSESEAEAEARRRNEVRDGH